MSKELAIACFYIGKSYGKVCEKRDLEDETSHEQDRAKAKELISWAALAVDMIEVGHGMDMAYPEDYEYEIYTEFGDWFGEYCDDNGNDSPSDENCIQHLIDFVINAFSGMLGSDLLSKLRYKLDQMVK